MRHPLWIPSEERKQQANITRFIEQVNAWYGLKISSYAELYRWSVENIPDFWAAMWDFAGIKILSTLRSGGGRYGQIPGGQVVSERTLELCRKSAPLP